MHFKKSRAALLNVLGYIFTPLTFDCKLLCTMYTEFFMLDELLTAKVYVQIKFVF